MARAHLYGSEVRKAALPLGEQFDHVLGAARTGAEWAWAALYRELAPAVLGYLRGQRAPSPEDVTGEVFLQVVRDLHRFDGNEAQFRSWVFTIAHHRLIDARRSQQRRPADPQPAEHLERHLPIATTGTEAEALGRMSAHELRRLLGGLTADQRDVLLLRLVADLTIPQIASLMGKRTGAIKALQRRALRACEQLLRPAPYPSPPHERSHPYP